MTAKIFSHPIAGTPDLIFAHQGGWDELLWIAGPLVLVGLLLFVANRRANALANPTTGTPESIEATNDDSLDPKT